MRNKTILALSLFTAPLVGCAVQPGSVGSQSSALLTAGDVLIAQVYGGGGNANEAIQNDYVVLYNTTSSAVALTGYSVYVSNDASPTPTITETTLTGSIPATSAYLISGLAGTSGDGGAALPTPDKSDTAMSILSSKGSVALNVSSSIAPLTAALDLVGWGGSTAEGTAAGAMSVTTALIRNHSGVTCTNTSNNSSDFTLTTVGSTNLPPNSSATIANCSAPDPAVIDMTVLPDLTTTSHDLAIETSADGAVASTTDLAGTPTPAGDGGSVEPTGNQPKDNNGTPPVYTPGGSIGNGLSTAGGRGYNGCSVGGNAATTPWFAGLLVAGFALAFRRRRSA